MAKGGARKKAARGTQRQRPEPDPETRVMQAAMHLAALQGWSDTSLSDIAEEADVPLEEMRRRYPSKLAVLTAFTRHIDEAVLRGTDPQIAAEPLRDRLFDVVMRRFEALGPYREGVRAVSGYLSRNPAECLCYTGGPFLCSLNWMLDAARVPTWGPLQPLQVQGFAGIYANAMRVWMRDESEDLGATMAALDKSLQRADALLGMVRRPGRRRRREPEPAGED